ncbi:hypothetical protein ACFY1P_34845 [Streptomyces sp. NPDC001407]
MSSPTGAGTAFGYVGQVHHHAVPRTPATWPHLFRLLDEYRDR